MHQTLVPTASLYLHCLSIQTVLRLRFCLVSFATDCTRGKVLDRKFLLKY
jgi:hypothetical protein